MIDKRLLVFRSFDSTFDPGVSSGSTGELLKDWSGIALIALYARIESVASVLPLEVFACVLAIYLLLALSWVAEVGVEEAEPSLLWDVMIEMKDLLLDEAVDFTMYFCILAIVLPNDRTHVCKSERLLETCRYFISKLRF